MTPQQAAQLAIRIGRTFNGPTANIWEEHLVDFDEGRAGTAIRRAEVNHKGARLSIAEFLDFYRSVNTDDASTRPPDCPKCDGSGWVEGPGHPVKTDGEDRMNSDCVPCSCGEGARRADSAVWKYRGRSAA